MCLVIDNVNTSQNFDAVPAYFDETALTTTPNPASVTTGGNSIVLNFIGGDNDGVVTPTGPAGYTLGETKNHGSSTGRIHTAYKTVASDAVTEDPDAWTAVESNQWISATVSVRTEAFAVPGGGVAAVMLLTNIC